MRSLILKGILIYALFSSFAFGSVFDEAKILNEKVVEKVNLISQELKTKTGVEFVLLTLNNPNNVSLKELSEDYIKNLKSPFVVLALSPKNLNQDSGKVDIFMSDESLFDKEEVLSPRTNTGSILPILSRKGKDIYNAALLNGSGDIADKIAAKFGVELENSLGSSNRMFLNLLRYPLYATILIVILIFIYRKSFGKK